MIHRLLSAAVIVCALCVMVTHEVSPLTAQVAASALVLFALVALVWRPR